MGYLEGYLKRTIKSISVQQKALIISVFLSGVLAHGYMFANNLTYHDGVLSINSLGATFNLGRFVLGFMEIVGRNTVGMFASPLFHGMLSLLFIAFSGMLILDILHIQGILSAVYTGIIMAVFPVVASIFAYMYTSSAYWCALFLNVLSVRILMKKQNVKRLVVSVVILIVGLGIYQAYFTIAVILFLLSVIVNLLEEMRIPVRDIIFRAIWYFFAVGGSLIGYLITNKVVITIGGIGLSSYKGVDEMGNIELSRLPEMIRSAYENFFLEMKWGGINGVICQQIMVMGIILLTIVLMMLTILKSNGEIRNKFILTLLLLLLPGGINSIYLMSFSDNYSVHILMRYSLVFVFIVPVIFLEHVEQLDDCKRGVQLCKKTMMNCLLVFMWILPVTYIYLDNAAYLKADFFKEQAVTWFTELISEIKSTDGYKDELPVVYIGERAVEDLGQTKMPYFDNVYLDGFDYDLNELVNNYAWRAFIEKHCGYAPEEIWEREEYEKMDEIKQMPIYPDKGSIRVINGTVVVKLS